jgi:hypothetical protein
VRISPTRAAIVSAGWAAFTYRVVCSTLKASVAVTVTRSSLFSVQLIGQPST